MPVEVDFSDYKDVDGYKLPSRVAYVWLDGRDAIILNDVKVNVPIDQAKFGRPPAMKKK